LNILCRVPNQDIVRNLHGARCWAFSITYIQKGMASPAPSTDSTQDGTQFIPQSDDEETLWKVIEITAERPKQYKVKWEGINPDTGKPWAQSWVPKSDCTDDLRKVWKMKLNDTKKGGKGMGGYADKSIMSKR
jgi:hypothetical protein